MQRFFALGLDQHFLGQLAAELGDLLDPDSGLTLGRVAAGAHGKWQVLTPEGDGLAQAVGSLRGEVVVGDWLVVQTDRDPWIATRRLERRTALRRRDPSGGVQVVAANVDVALLCTAVGPELSARRTERWLAVAREAGCEPVIVLTKADLGVEESLALLAPLGCEVLAVSSLAGEGVDAVAAMLRGRTGALLGSSGVGKSTLLNALIGGEEATHDVRRDGKGRHTTTWRSLHALPGGGWLIDNPGVREVGLVAEEGVDAAFADIEAFASQCRWRQCSHEAPEGCAVLAAIEAGELDPARLASWRKLAREATYEAVRSDPAARAEREAKWRKIHMDYRARQRFEGKD